MSGVKLWRRYCGWMEEGCVRWASYFVIRSVVWHRRADHGPHSEVAR